MNTSRTNLRIGVAVAAIAAAGAAAHGHGGHAQAPAPKPTPAEIAAFEAARPAFEHHCFRCHTSAGKKSKRKALADVAMDRYPFAGHHAGDAGKAIRKVLGKDGKSKATMPSDDPGVVAGDDLTKILAWADEFDRAHATKHPARPTTKESTQPH
jgi:hypothetical protein